VDAEAVALAELTFCDRGISAVTASGDAFASVTASPPFCRN
jgi:hypothetical protein